MFRASLGLVDMGIGGYAAIGWCSGGFGVLAVLLMAVISTGGLTRRRATHGIV